MVQSIPHFVLEVRVSLQALLCLGRRVLGLFVHLEPAVMIIIAHLAVVGRIHVPFCPESLSNSLILGVLRLLGPQSVTLSVVVTPQRR